VKAIIVIAAVLISLPLMGADVPQGSPRDNRIQHVNYHPSDVVVVHARVGYVSRIVFGDDEVIESTAAGFADGWDLNPKGNILFLKPRSIAGDNDTEPAAPEPKMWNTNIVVATDKRLYDIELRLLAEGHRGDEQAFYRVTFSYPIDEAKVLKLEKEKAKAKDRQKALAKPEQWNYTMVVGKSSSDIKPSMAFDDGTFTYLRFPKAKDFPTVFIVAADGAESVVNSHVNPEYPDTMVVHRVAGKLILRLGRSVIEIRNNSFHVEGERTASAPGTSIASTTRVAQETRR